MCVAIVDRWLSGHAEFTVDLLDFRHTILMLLLRWHDVLSWRRWQRLAIHRFVVGIFHFGLVVGRVGDALLVGTVRLCILTLLLLNA